MSNLDTPAGVRVQVNPVPADQLLTQGIINLAGIPLPAWHLKHGAQLHVLTPAGLTAQLVPMPADTVVILPPVELTEALVRELRKPARPNGRQG